MEDGCANVQTVTEQPQGLVVLLGESLLQVQQLVVLPWLPGEPGHRVQLLQNSGIEGQACQRGHRNPLSLDNFDLFLDQLTSE